MPESPLPGPCLGFRLFGVPTWVHWSFPGVGLGIGVPLGALTGLVATHLALAVFAWAIVAVAVVVFVHELGHAVAARLLSMEIEGLCFAAGGGCCLAGQAPSHMHQLLYSAAGLVVQLPLLACTVSLHDWSVSPLALPAADGVAVFTGVNLLLLIANAWPSGNTDGQRVLRALRALRAGPAGAPASRID